MSANTLDELIASYHTRKNNSTKWFEDAQNVLKGFQIQYMRDKPQDGDDPKFGQALNRCRYYSADIRECNHRIGILESTKKTLGEAKQFCLEASPHALICMLRAMKQISMPGIKDVPRYERLLREPGEAHDELKNAIASFNKDVFGNREKYEASLETLASAYMTMAFACRDAYMGKKQKRKDVVK